VPTISFGSAFGVGGSGDDSGEAIAADAAGNLYVSGTFQGTADMDPGPGQVLLTASGSGFDGLVATYSAAGAPPRAQRMGGTQDDYAFGVAVNATGTVYVTGGFSGTATFGAGTLTSVGDSDIYLTTLDSAGNFLWTGQLGGSDPAGAGVEFGTDVAL